MNFAQYLKQYKIKNNLNTSKSCYEALGIEKELQITYQQYHLIESGKQKPSEKFLCALFKKIPTVDHKIVILSYLRTVLNELDGGELILDYIFKYLTPPVSKGNKNLWEIKKNISLYSDEQLTFLTNNPRVMRFHKRVLLYENVPLAECPLRKDEIKKLKNLYLIKVMNKVVMPFNTFYQTPTPANSNPRSVSKATDYILKHIDLFISKEGSERQKLLYCIHMVPPHLVPTILEEFRAFKRWLDSLATDKGTPGDVPFFFMGIAKQLDKNKEL